MTDARAVAQKTVLDRLLIIGHQETPCVFGGFQCLVCDEQDVTIQHPADLAHDDDCTVPALIDALTTAILQRERETWEAAARVAETHFREVRVQSTDTGRLWRDAAVKEIATALRARAQEA